MNGQIVKKGLKKKSSINSSTDKNGKEKEED